MVALSIRQPWAWLIVHGHKDVENRTWSHRHRGPVLIHAGRAFDADGYNWIKEDFPGIELPRMVEFDRGGIVGRADVVGCVNRSTSPWFFGPHAFVLARAEPLPFQPCRGQLGFFVPEVPHAG
ncbi:ASCH domain-containing protein [Gaopeijia maritima]|uniref:ASCH domain-containing protein n=1 Tax=Gaopeijia maritima TaxID=3119007 RepID=UPI00386BB2B7